MRARPARRPVIRRPASPRPPQEHAWTDFEQRTLGVQEGITRWLHVGETFVLITVALLLLITGIIVAFDAMHTLVDASHASARTARTRSSLSPRTRSWL